MKLRHFTVETEEKDGRWLAEVQGFPGALAYGKTKAEAMRRAVRIAKRMAAELDR
jgi:predicted RNase H-like HicB family nuclease